MNPNYRYVDFGQGLSAVPGLHSTLDREHYTGTATMDREWQHMWRKSWLVAGLAQDVVEPGDFLTFDLGKESILVSRTESGSLSAVYNVCQHRGNKLQPLPFGWIKKHVCPYHGWTYALDGTLETVPDRERFSQGVDCALKSLKPVQVESWSGFVWVNMDPQAPPLAQFLGSIMPGLEAYRIAEMRIVRDQSVTIDANWKTVIDNFAEVYHVDFLHPQHASFVNCRDSRIDLMPYGHTLLQVDGYVLNPRYPTPEVPPPILADAIKGLGLKPDEFVGRVGDVRRAVQMQKRRLGAQLGFDYSRFSDDQVSDIWQYNLFPNVVLTVKPEEVWVMRPRPHPHDPNKCIFDKWTLAMPFEQRSTDVSLVLIGDPQAAKIMSSGERPGREVFSQEDVNDKSHSLTETVDQDIYFLPNMQAGMHSAGFESAWLNDDETRISHFHDWLEMWLRAGTG